MPWQSVPADGLDGDQLRLAWGHHTHFICNRRATSAAGFLGESLANQHTCPTDVCKIVACTSACVF